MKSDIQGYRMQRQDAKAGRCKGCSLVQDGLCFHPKAEKTGSQINLPCAKGYVYTENPIAGGFYATVYNNPGEAKNFGTFEEARNWAIAKANEGTKQGLLVASYEISLCYTGKAGRLEYSRRESFNIIDA